MRDRDGGGNLTKVQCKHLQKCYNELPHVQLMYANKNALTKKECTLTLLPVQNAHFVYYIGIVLTFIIAFIITP
jgi:hypothetical protein